LASLLLPCAALAQDRPLELVGIDYRLHYWPELQAQADVTAAAAQAAVPRLRRALDLPPGERVDIYLARTAQEFRRLTGGSDPNLVLGEAFPERRTIVLQPLTGEPLRRLVVHELMHVLLQDKVAETGAEPPRWLHEGLAKYAAEDFSPTDRMLLTDAVNQGKLIPLPDLDKAFGGSPEKVSLAYAESYTLVDFLANLEPARGLGPFLRQLGQVGEVNRALMRAYNLTPEAFAEQWRRHMLLEYLGRSNQEVGTILIWAGIVALFLLLLVRQLRRSAAIRRRLEEEERARERMSMWSLPARGWGEATGETDAAEDRDGDAAPPEEDSDEW
jgi:hypothetical protein